MYNHHVCDCVIPENIQTPTTEGIENSRGVGGSMAQEIPSGYRSTPVTSYQECSAIDASYLSAFSTNKVTNHCLLLLEAEILPSNNRKLSTHSFFRILPIDLRIAVC